MRSSTSSRAATTMIETSLAARIARHSSSPSTSGSPRSSNTTSVWGSAANTCQPYPTRVVPSPCRWSTLSSAWATRSSFSTIRMFMSIGSCMR